MVNFKNRQNIAWNQVCDESYNVNSDSVIEWKSKIFEFIKYYGACNIYNCGETGLFFRDILNTALQLKREQCKGLKLSKERLTILLCGNMVGDTDKPLVIGKSAKLKYFKTTLIWCTDKKAWMKLAYSVQLYLFKDYRKFIVGTLR